VGLGAAKRGYQRHGFLKNLIRKLIRLLVEHCDDNCHCRGTGAAFTDQRNAG
jgi:hypothetical protein